MRAIPERNQLKMSETEKQQSTGVELEVNREREEGPGWDLKKMENLQRLP